MNAQTEVQKVKGSISRMMSEFTDCHLVIAFEPISGMPIMLVNVPDPKSAMAINLMLRQVLEQGGVGVTQ